ncbi:MAG: 23S rRNA (pseudouridine(1915)-N(3))-methyltransferase RlmH [candidate division WOR-3 bacterium]|nr:23S rRNA (pseudouridine(1915)-N(3))-methyltransferase RlmH [candidate division WOR-3 bacterium]
MIRIICIGKTEPIEIKKLKDYYLNLIRRYTKIEFIELKETSSQYKEHVIKEQCRKILSAIRYKPVLLDVFGRELSSVQFSIFLKENVKMGVDFIIGGVWGVCDEIKKFNSISLSRMTFNHNIIRIMLLEQIYRAFEPKYSK